MSKIYQENLLTRKLTFRENEIVKLRVKGNNYKQIASALNISESTVKTHLKNIHKKLNVNTHIEFNDVIIS